MSNAVKSNRDDWVYDFDMGTLRSKALFFADTYNELLDRNNESYPPVIKWSSTQRDRFKRGEHLVYNDANRLQALYRPFVPKHYFAETAMNDRLTRNHSAMFGRDLQQENNVICFQATGARRPFAALASDKLVDGERVSNITDGALRQINDYYRKGWGKHFEELAGGDRITAEDIFAYNYAILHDPDYRHEYRFDLLREFPRIPLFRDFNDWAHWGRALLDLHIGFESAEPFPLERRDVPLPKDKPPKPILRADKQKGLILLDEQTTLAGVPQDSWRYVLGSRSALEWVLDQYKEKKPRDPTIRESSTPTASPTTKSASSTCSGASAQSATRP